jgi:hypothetical protein
MTEPKKVGLAAAVAGGYVLGRNKKGRLALTAAALLLGRALNPGEQVAEGIRKLGGAAGAKGLDDTVRGDIARAGRDMASAVANRRLSSFTKALHERTLALTGESDADDSEAEEEEDTGAEEAEETEEEAPARGSRRGKPGGREAGSGGSGEKAAARKKRPAPAEKAKKAEKPEKAGKKSPAKKQPPAKKTAAKKTAPAGRKTTSRSSQGR